MYYTGLALSRFYSTQTASEHFKADCKDNFTENERIIRRHYRLVCRSSSRAAIRLVVSKERRFRV